MSIQAKPHHLQAIQNLLAPYRYLYYVELEATCDDVGVSVQPSHLLATSSREQDSFCAAG